MEKIDRKKQKLFIKKSIKELGLKTQSDLAELVGISTQTIRHWSSGSVMIPKWFFKFIDCVKENKGKSDEIHS